ncbi:MAG: cbb3-type cytochrome c oxidase subunit I [Bacteroidetes bacterium]|nr:cbb3-type cytochrome c oxidase subunit I [Bacteroidota bacterium]MBS1539625.1 cbb3-type cytochrome c oxidase subunit I [Bacteroidota bacterium]
MEQLPETNLPATKKIILTALALLLLGMFFGILGSLQYVVPGILKTQLSFEKIRPLHVSSVVFWIMLAASGGVLTYAGERSGKLFSRLLAKIQWLLFLFSVVAILTSYMLGIFGGREYWEFPPLLAIPVWLGWLLFTINLVGTIRTFKQQPVYVWMWLTGAFGFLFIFSESYLWMLPFFQKSIVRDMTVQWKSYGSMVGCWNMLVYGSGIYLMEKISKDPTPARSRMAFALYFLSLTNLMFNWSHHIYTLPILPAIKHIGYLISMSELYILGRIIYKWKSSVKEARKFEYQLPYRFLIAADVWVFLNLILAILMSIPAVNLYTHGTHITVAHVMGTTIGINSMLLMAVVTDVLDNTCRSLYIYQKKITQGLVTANLSLFVFLGALLMAGIKRSQWQMSDHRVPFGEMMHNLIPYFILFSMAGIVLFGAFCVMVYPLVKNVWACYTVRQPQSTVTPSFN